MLVHPSYQELADWHVLSQELGNCGNGLANLDVAASLSPQASQCRLKRIQDANISSFHGLSIACYGYVSKYHGHPRLRTDREPYSMSYTGLMFYFDISYST